MYPLLPCHFSFHFPFFRFLHQEWYQWHLYIAGGLWFDSSIWRWIWSDPTRKSMVGGWEIDGVFFRWFMLRCLCFFFFGDWWNADLGWGRTTWIKVFFDFTWILWCFMSCCERKRRCFNRLRRWIFGPDFLLSFKKEHFQPSPIWILFFQMGKFQFAIQTFSGKSWLSWSQNWPSACQPLTCLPKWSCSEAQFLPNISALQ